MRNPAIIIAMSAAALAATAPALAGEGTVRHERVKVTDEDFANAWTIARLQRSIAQAAQRVCQANDQAGSPSPDQQRCIDEAIRDAQAGIVRISTRHGVPLPADTISKAGNR